MTIGVCDDDKEYLEKEIALCRDCLPGDHSFYRFYDGRELLAVEEALDLVLLDIEMPNINGIEVKEKLQMLSEQTVIVFVTNHREFVMDAFDINVIGFVVKGMMEEQLPIVLDKAEKLLNRYTLIEGAIDSRDVLYIRSEHNYGKFRMQNGEDIMVRGSMNGFEERLAPFGFVRVHRQFLVNMSWVDKVGGRGNYIQVFGERIAVSARERGRVKQCYRDYRKRNARFI